MSGCRNFRPVRKLAVLLRGVNLGGHNKVPMADLRRILGDLGYADVKTLLNSGNAVVSTAESAAHVERNVSAAINDELGLSVQVVVRTHAQLAAVVRGSPLDHVVTESRYYTVWFLAETPTRSTLGDVEPDRYAPDYWVHQGQELYVWYASGQGKTKIPGPFFEKQLKVAGTARNWNTVLKLLELTN